MASNDGLIKGLCAAADRWSKGDHRRNRKYSEQEKESREWAKLAKKIEDRANGKLTTCPRCGVENYKRYFKQGVCPKCDAARIENEAYELAEKLWKEKVDAE